MGWNTPWPALQRPNSGQPPGLTLTLVLGQYLWIPGWYALDQSLKSNHLQKLAFWREVPAYLQETERWVFFNSLWEPNEVVVYYGLVLQMRHPQLGSIDEISAEDLDYTFKLHEGKELIVNAEECPGKIYERLDGNETIESNLSIWDWKVVVHISQLDRMQ